MTAGRSGWAAGPAAAAHGRLRLTCDGRSARQSLMAVVHTAGARDAQQDLTSDKALLLAAISRTTGRALRSATAALIDEYNVVRRPVSEDSPMNEPDQALRGRDAQIVDPDQALRAQQASNSINSLRAVIDSLSGVRGRRKAVLFVSEGMPYDFAGLLDLTPATSVRNALRDAMAAAARANVVVYAIDPRGLDTQAGEDIAISRYPETDEPGLDRRSLDDEQSRAQGSLQTLSADTGGFAVIDTSDLSDAFERIVRENSSYYLLAYDAPEHKPDGKFHKIEVRVKRPGLQVHHRRGYASPQSRGKAKKISGNPRIQAALQSPLPVEGLGLTAFAAPFRTGSGRSWVLLGAEVSGRDLSLDGEGTLEITSVAVDSRGEVRGGATERAPLTLRSETRARIRQTAIRVLIGQRRARRCTTPSGRLIPCSSRRR